MLIEVEFAVVRPVSLAGVVVEAFEDRQQAFEVLEEELPDLIVLDIIMGEISGIEVCKKDKSGEKTSGFTGIVDEDYLAGDGILDLIQVGVKVSGR